MSDPDAYLNATLGLPGSGRVRYGAAMDLWRQGLISAEALEDYRIASAQDEIDPPALLWQKGLPEPAQTVPQSTLHTLYTAAREYLLKLDHTGAADVRAGLPTDPGAECRIKPRGHAIVDQWLPEALDALAQTCAPLATAIGAAAPLLDWISYDRYPPDQIGPGFAKGHAYASILGAAAPFAAHDFDLGLFLIAPHVLYRDHHHAAPELYAPLTGPHGWRFGAARPLTIKPAHDPVWNPPHQPHLTKVGAVPFLCLFVWTKDVKETAQVIPADDWTALEDARIA